jgi:hypothetical protein
MNWEVIFETEQPGHVWRGHVTTLWLLLVAGPWGVLAWCLRWH